MAQGEVIELLKKYVILLNAEGISVKRAYLFGSYSDNTEKESSDIDVLIVSDNYDETDDLAIGLAWKTTRKITTKIEPYFIGIQKFEKDTSSPLISMIKEKGIQII